MSNNRRSFTAQQNADMVCRHLKDKVPVSTLAEELGIQSTQIYQWVAMLLEQADRVFERADRQSAAARRAEAKANELKSRQIQ